MEAARSASGEMKGLVIGATIEGSDPVRHPITAACRCVGARAVSDLQQVREGGLSAWRRSESLARKGPSHEDTRAEARDDDVGADVLRVHRVRSPSRGICIPLLAGRGAMSLPLARSGDRACVPCAPELFTLERWLAIARSGGVPANGRAREQIRGQATRGPAAVAPEGRCRSAQFQ